MLTNRRAMLAACGLALIAAALTAAFQGSSEPAAVHTIRLVIDYDDGVQKVFTRLPWQANMTVQQALEAAKASPHGIALSANGDGPTFLVKKIDDLENQRGGGGRNWQYWINGQYAQVGAGAQKLAPDDVVLWRYTSSKQGE